MANYVSAYRRREWQALTVKQRNYCRTYYRIMRRNGVDRFDAATSANSCAMGMALIMQRVVDGPD